jgi:hypothetical protein
MTENSAFGFGLLLYALCIGVSLLLWPYIKTTFGPDMTPYTRSEPYDAASAQRGGYSPFYPGRR